MWTGVLRNASPADEKKFWMRVCRFLKGQIWRGILERVLAAAGVPGKLYCAELYLFFALIQPNTKAGLVMTRAGEKFLTGASITVVISIITTRVFRGMKGSQIPVSRPVKAAGEAMLLRHSGRTSVLQPTQTL